MIERYSRPEMTRLWTDEYRFEKMLEVELLATEALVKKGKVPAKALATIRRKAKIHVPRIREIEKTLLDWMPVVPLTAMLFRMRRRSNKSGRWSMRAMSGSENP